MLDQMLPIFLLTLREGVEVALIMGIILAYLNRTDRQQLTSSVWAGLALAAVVTALLGVLIFQVMGGFDPDIESEKNMLRTFEGVSCLLAAGVLTWVIVWMHRNARHLGSQLRTAVDATVGKNQAWAITGLVFVTAGREGLETVLILPGLAKGAATMDIVMGIALGLAGAIFVGVLLHRGSRTLDIQRFFKVTGVLLIFFAAGLVAYGIHELQDAGRFPVLMKDVWNINHLLNDKAGVGLLLKSLFGYNGNPEIIELLAYVSYLSASLMLFLKSPKVDATPA
jgi:high-affinity iron transporter